MRARCPGRQHVVQRRFFFRVGSLDRNINSTRDSREEIAEDRSPIKSNPRGSSRYFEQREISLGKEGRRSSSDVLHRSPMFTRQQWSTRCKACEPRESIHGKTSRLNKGPHFRRHDDFASRTKRSHNRARLNESAVRFRSEISSPRRSHSQRAFMQQRSTITPVRIRVSNPGSSRDIYVQARSGTFTGCGSRRQPPFLRSNDAPWNAAGCTESEKLS